MGIHTFDQYLILSHIICTADRVPEKEPISFLNHFIDDHWYGRKGSPSSSRSSERGRNGSCEETQDQNSCRHRTSGESVETKKRDPVLVFHHAYFVVLDSLRTIVLTK